MLGRRRRANKTLFVAGGLEDLVPEDHLLRRVDAAVEFSWVREMVAETYSPSMGRPSIDPEAAVRLMLGGYLLGIVHDRALMRLARVNVALRWFAGFALDERLPHHSSLTRLRQRWGVERFRRMFVRVVGLCQEAGLLGREVVHIDATLIRSDASRSSVVAEHVEQIVSSNGDAEGGDSGHEVRDGVEPQGSR